MNRYRPNPPDLEPYFYGYDSSSLPISSVNELNSKGMK